MMNLLKLLGKGLLYIILLPIGIVFFTVYGIVMFIIWLVYLFRTLINFFKGKKSGLVLPEDIKAIEILNNSRDFSTPTPQASAPGVTFNFNVNGQNVASRDGQVVHDALNHQDVIDISNQDDPKKIEGDK
jgi:hypothetical protein